MACTGDPFNLVVRQPEISAKGLETTPASKMEYVMTQKAQYISTDCHSLLLTDITSEMHRRAMEGYSVDNVRTMANC